ncbi:hypothetical protein FPOA_08606 [Fusarium poae]|uniref:Uncharacterized protein n=1 Tax=Fusarium poae TaxID=36050 RepID=A0A1B8AP27_FUSPO|nr:hypothetical protein FPOA_08606 [Fusarium poae]
MTSQCHDRLSSGVRNDQQDAWLFKLPLEILRDIYRYLFGDRTIFVHTRWYSEPECWTHGLIIKGPDKTHNDTEDRLSFNILQSCTLAYATGIDELYYSNDFVCRGVNDFKRFHGRFLSSRDNILRINLHLDIDLSIFCPSLLFNAFRELRAADFKRMRLSMKSTTRHERRVSLLTTCLATGLWGGGKNNAYLELVPTMVDIAKGQLERFGCQNKEIEVTLVQYVDESDEEDD